MTERSVRHQFTATFNVKWRRRISTPQWPVSQLMQGCVSRDAGKALGFSSILLGKEAHMMASVSTAAFYVLVCDHYLGRRPYSLISHALTAAVDVHDVYIPTEYEQQSNDGPKLQSFSNRGAIVTEAIKDWAPRQSAHLRADRRNGDQYAEAFFKSLTHDEPKPI